MRVLSALVRRLLARPGTVLLAAFLSTIPMGFWSVQLFGDLRADLKELLPASASSVITLRELERRFGGFSQLSMIVESPEPTANRMFSDDLVKELEGEKSIRSVRNKLGPEREFFEKRRHLFIELEDLKTILERIEDAANDARARANPLIVDLEDAEPVKLDFADLEKKYERRFALAKRFPDGYFESKDKHQLAILVRKEGLAFGIEGNRELVRFVESKILKLNPRRYHPDLTVGIGGDVKNLIEEHDSLVEDLVLASVIVALLLGLVVVVYYRRFRALYLVAIPLLIGCTWTFGVSHFLIGYLNASSAFLGPIVPGNGINFGLILLARYIEEHRKGQSIEDSVQIAVRHTAKATSVVALAASVAYGSLFSTDFLGFKHFGIIGGVGMLLCWCATFIVLPPLILWAERRFPIDAGRELKMYRPGALSAIPSRLVFASPRLWAWGGVTSAILSVLAIVFFLRDPFEKNFHKLRSTVSTERGSAVVVRKVDAVFDSYQEPQVIIADSDAEAALTVKELEKVIREGGEMGPLDDVTALSTFVPLDQKEKLEVLGRIREVLSDQLLENLDDDQRKLAREHRPPADLEAFAATDLPDSIRAEFRELDGREGRVVLAVPNMKLNLWHADEIQKVAAALRTITLPDGKRVASSGNFVIYADMLDAVGIDGPKATLYSFLGVLLLCAVAYRRLRRVLIVCGALLVGVAWLGAILALTDTKVNFLNFIALPITFGIGADYAVNIYSRYLIEREHSNAREAARITAESTGGAVVLCSMTTIIGYGSLLVARNGALISFGKVAILGEFACLAAALFILPAWLVAWRDD